MKGLYHVFLAAAFVFVLMTGCADERITAPSLLEAPDISAHQADDGISLLRSRFTGRDSFGVALNAGLSGTYVETTEGPCDDVTVTLSGEGTATHLGRVEIEQNHCVDTAYEPDSITAGEFTLTGTTGGQLSGTYRGEGDGTFRAQLIVDDGDVRATRVSQEEGKGTLEGELDASSGRFRYTLDGWLLHHVRE